MTTEFQPLSIQGSQKVYDARWRLVGETLEWEIEGKTFRIESARDLAGQVEDFVRVLSKSVFRDQMKLRACLTCRNFQMSSMARDMGRGQRGVCGLHLWRVEICFLCDDFSGRERTAGT